MTHILKLLSKNFRLRVSQKTNPGNSISGKENLNETPENPYLYAVTEMRCSLVEHWNFINMSFKLLASQPKMTSKVSVPYRNSCWMDIVNLIIWHDYGLRKPFMEFIYQQTAKVLIKLWSYCRHGSSLFSFKACFISQSEDVVSKILKWYFKLFQVQMPSDIKIQHAQLMER